MTGSNTSSLVLALLAGLLLSGCGDGDGYNENGYKDESDSTESAATESSGGMNDMASGYATASGMTDEAPALASDDVAFLSRLGLIRGHLHAGHALYINDYRDMAATHMKHPRDELYAGLEPAIEARGFQPFDDRLTVLKDAVDSGADGAEVTEAWREIDEAIETIERGVDASAADELRAVADMLETAAEEYAVGVVDGVVANEHEYQDAWGFTQIALERVGQIAATSDVERSATAQAAVVISSLADLWPELAPVEVPGAEADRIAGAADQLRALADGMG
ncbi:hypothetical protein [Halomonas denitrificans]|nr:hypothetical protein [Halomonas denitrificans]